MKRSERSDAEIQLSKQVVQTFPSEASFNECFKAEVAAGSLMYSGYILYYIAGAA